MKKILKLTVLAIAVLIAAVFLLLTSVTIFLPNIPVEEVKIEYTPERIERGRYLANNVAQCVDCHSTRDWSRFSGPIVSGTEGKGGESFNRQIGYPGDYHSTNITPHALKDWSDGELFRAITAGVSRGGRPLFPVMPYPYFGKMDKEDVYSIIAYLRTLPSIENDVPPSETRFPMSVIIHLIPSKPEFSSLPPASDKVNRGRYLANAAWCVECHTQTKRGQIIPEMQFGGGRYLPMPDGSTSISSNITPDKETGIGNWTEESFVARFKAYDKSVNNVNDAVKPGEHNSLMPWSKYAQMSEEDLAAIYAYLKTVKPVQNKVGRTYIKK